MAVSFAIPRYDLPRASRALAALMRNPDDLPQVFTLLEAMSGTAPHRLLRRFRRTPTGARLLRDEPDIVPILADREGLRRLPAGSLGRAYLAFVESEGISAQEILDASRAGRSSEPRPRAFRYLRDRMRDTHDLWHAVTGYKGDTLGELALLAFILAQNFNLALAMIVGGGLLKGIGRTDMHLVIDGYRRGRAAAWLPPQDWETMLALPIDEVRRRLHLGPAPEYTPIRTVDMRAAGVI
ncbi:MAG TPA: Coq4 family protein [Polyangiaceae bacterium]|nr:Coq4 family protein [Polyangiaceae bacterium]